MSARPMDPVELRIDPATHKEDPRVSVIFMSAMSDSIPDEGYALRVEKIPVPIIWLTLRKMTVSQPT